MISLYQDIVTYDGVNFHDHLGRIGAFSIFEPLLTSREFDENVDQIKACKYIVYTHSLESTKIHVGGDRRKMLMTVFKELGLADKYYESLVLLKSQAVVSAVQAWMGKQDDKQLAYLFTLQNVYIQQQAAALSPLKKADLTNIDYDQKQKCIQHMTELKKMIKDAESELQQNDPKLKEVYEEVKMAAKKTNTLGVEKYAY